MSMSRTLISGAALALPVTSAFAAEIQIQAQNPVVELTINEVVQSEPDSAQVGAGVQVRAQTASEALRKNAEQMEKVIARLHALGIKAADIQTANFSLNAQYQYRNDGEAPTFLGYDASNQVNVMLRDLTKIGRTLDALVEAGANNVYGPNFMLQKDEAARSAGRKSAFEKARVQGLEYAKMAGFSGIKLLEVSESYNAMGPVMMAQAVTVSARANGSAKTPIEPGMVGTGVNVTVKYEMTR
ncbi:MAG TPA: SIMPL domain-containing protein [Novosphingobium sp.]|nr:SIMPL domain-containing protein [Novosphingobium sp.]